MIEFINNQGGKMFVDESRVDEYLAAGYMLAANVIDSTCVVSDAIDESINVEPAEKKVRRKRK